MNGSLLPRHLDRQLRSLERVAESHREPITALRETVEAIWNVVEQAASEPALDTSRPDAGALLARRELLHRGTGILSAVIRGGVESGAFRPGCASWAIRRLPFAIVAGACVHWVFGLATTPSLPASTAVAAALEVLRPGRSSAQGGSPRSARLESRAVPLAPRRVMAMALALGSGSGLHSDRGGSVPAPLRRPGHRVRDPFEEVVWAGV